MKTINLAHKDATEKLQAELDTVQKRCRERTITAEDIVAALHEIETELSISKKSMEGIRVCVDCHAQSFPRAYKYTPESTQFFAEYKNGGWRVEDIDRYPVCAPSKRIDICHTEESRAAILRRFENWG